MDMVTAARMAEKWGLSLRTVQNLCKQGKIPGAQRFGTHWMIPQQAIRPRDGRRKSTGDPSVNHHPLIRKSPFLDMTDLYCEPGAADQSIERLADYPEEQALLRAEIAYSRGQIDQVYTHAREFLDSRSGFYAVIAGGMLLARTAVWKGDIRLWNEAHKHFFDAPCKNELDRDIVELTIAATDGVIRDTNRFPEWFSRGCFDNLPRDAHPAARVYYIRHLLVQAQEVAFGNLRMESIHGFGMMRMLPLILEPMISQMVVDKIVMAEIQLRLLTAIAYRQCGDHTHAAEHLDKAILRCLPDGLFAPLVEYRNQLGLFLDDRLAMIDPEALKQVKLLHKQYLAGWTKLHNAVLNKQVQVTLSSREREVTRLAAFGMTDAQIAAQLHISESSVKSAIRTAKNKTGVNTRKELAIFV